MSFMTDAGKTKASLFCHFFKPLIHNASTKIFLIVDGQPGTPLIAGEAVCTSNERETHVFYLPPYFPELNPDELEWNNVKGKTGQQ